MKSEVLFSIIIITCLLSSGVVIAVCDTLSYSPRCVGGDIQYCPNDGYSDYMIIDCVNDDCIEVGADAKCQSGPAGGCTATSFEDPGCSGSSIQYCPDDGYSPIGQIDCPSCPGINDCYMDGLRPKCCGGADLIITNIWLDDNNLWATIENQGLGDAGPSDTGSSQDGGSWWWQATPAIAAGTSIDLLLRFWECSGASDTIMVNADMRNVVDEYNDIDNHMGPITKTCEICCNEIDDDDDGRENAYDKDCDDGGSAGGAICWWTEWDDYSTSVNYESGRYACSGGKIVETIFLESYLGSGDQFIMRADDNSIMTPDAIDCEKNRIQIYDSSCNYLSGVIGSGSWSGNPANDIVISAIGDAANCVYTLSVECDGGGTSSASPPACTNCPAPTTVCNSPGGSISCGEEISNCIHTGNWKSYSVPGSGGKAVTVRMNMISGCSSGGIDVSSYETNGVKFEFSSDASGTDDGVKVSSIICGDPPPPPPPVCSDFACNGVCGVACTVFQDPDCGCRDSDFCCGIGCDFSNDNDCGPACTPDDCNNICPSDCTGNDDPDCAGACMDCDCASDTDCDVAACCGDGICQLFHGETANNCVDCCSYTCDGVCPAACGVADDPDCGCQDGDGCCGVTGCDSSNDDDCVSTDIAIRIEYSFVEKLLIPVIPYDANVGGDCTDLDGCPNFTKSMPIDFIVTAAIIDTATGREIRCIESNCEAFYDLDAAGWTSMTWDDFSAAQRAAPISSSLTCDQYYDLGVRVNEVGSAVTNTITKKIFINCEETLTVDPIEKIVPIGTQDLTLFNVTVWNPVGLSKDYYISMGTGHIQGFNILGVLDFCQTPESCSSNDFIDLVGVNAVGSRSVYVNLSVAGRSGVYEIKFTAIPSPDTEGIGQIEAYGVLAISSEGLNEFSLPQLLVLILFSTVIFYGFLTKRKNYISV